MRSGGWRARAGRWPGTGSLAERGLTPADLVMGVETVSPERADALIDAHDVALGFRGFGERARSTHRCGGPLRPAAGVRH